MTKKLDFDIVANNKASSAISGVGQDLQGLESKATKAGKDAGNGFEDSFGRSMQGVETRASRAGKEAGGGFRDSFQKRTRNVGSKLKGALKAGGAAAGAAAGTALMGGMQSAAAQLNMTPKIKAQLRLTEEEAARAGEAAGSVYRQGWGESLDQVRLAGVAVAQNLQMSVDDVDFQPLVRRALTFSEVFETDVVQSVKVAGQLIKTDMVKDGTEAFNVLTRLFQNAGTVSDDLLDTLTEYPTQFRQLGLDAQTATGLMIQGLEGGAQNSDKVADSLKELRIRIMDASAEDGLKELGLDIDKMAGAFAKGGPAAREALDTILTKLRNIKDPAKRTRVAMELMGTQAEDMAGALNEMDLSKARGEIGKVESAVDQAGATAQESVDTRWKKFQRGVSGALGDLATGDFPAFWDSASSLFHEKVPGAAVAASDSVDQSSRGIGGDLRRMGGAIDGVAGLADRLNRSIRRVPNRKRANVIGRVFGTRDVQGLGSAIAGVRSKTVYVNAVVSQVGSAVSSVGSVLGGTRAHGGPVQPGRSFLVGERGPELVRFSQRGQVHSNAETKRMLAGAAMPAAQRSKTVMLQSDGSGLSDLIVGTVREVVRAEGGDVQFVLGQE